jgi:hypothetical protein
VSAAHRPWGRSWLAVKSTVFLLGTEAGFDQFCDRAAGRRDTCLVHSIAQGQLASKWAIACGVRPLQGSHSSRTIRRPAATWDNRSATRAAPGCRGLHGRTDATAGRANRTALSVLRPSLLGGAAPRDDDLAPVVQDWRR